MTAKGGSKAGAGGHDGAVLVYATCSSFQEAETIGGALVEARLAACVNILPGMTSIYRWQGAIETGAEVVLIIKTRRPLADRIIEEVRRRHSYTNPAVLVLPVVAGSAPFLAWIDEQTAAE